ncbi:MAG: hypothetical protein KF855_03125, partial [Acidobacteria bacterium]|nr:hypothetical protein [Acidobacteriota bacterium]
VLAFYFEGQLITFYRAKELIHEKLGRGLNEYFEWSKPGKIDERSRHFTFTKLSGEKWVFDFTTGEVISNGYGSKTSNSSAQNSTLKTNKSSQSKNEHQCLGLMLISALCLTVRLVLR